MKPKIILCLALVLTSVLLVCVSCETDKMPSLKGTWIGVAKPVTLYDINRAPHEVLQLVVQDGPKGNYYGRQFSFPKVVIVDKEYYTVDPKFYEGRRLKIQGIAVISSVIDRSDKSRLMWTTHELDYEHMNPPAALRASLIEIIDSTNAPSSN